MDPTSVVRESEYMAAAESSGKIEKWGQIHDKIVAWEFLTEKQTKAFQALATEFIQNRAVSYNRTYRDMSNAYTQFWISPHLLPENAVVQLNDFIKEEEGADTQDFLWYVDSNSQDYDYQSTLPPL